MTIPAPAKRLLDFIRGYEAPHGFDTVFGDHMAQMPKPITRMTIDEVIADGPRRTRQFGSSAAGGLQFMTATLKALKARLKLTGREVMTAATQDALGYDLLKQRGYVAFMAGTLSVAGFGLNLAKEWASFPALAATQGAHRNIARGQSYYAGDGLNKALVKPAAVEAALQSLRASPALALSDDDPIERPRVATVPAPAAVSLPWWGRWFAPKAAIVVDRPGLKPNGDPALWDVQKALRDRAYYTKGTLDGLDGGFTQGAVAQARKDNGMGDGGIDADFLARLPGFPPRPVSVDRATASITAAAKHAPELFNPVKWLGGTGIGALVAGSADGSGLFDSIQATSSKVNDVAGSVQTAFGYVASVVGFLVEHRALVLFGVGVVLFLKAAGYALDGWIKFRQAFL